MVNPKGLSLWVKTKIDKHGGAEYKSNREFGRAYGIEPKTVKRLLDGKTVETSTLQKLADGLQMDLIPFLNFIEDFAKNQESQTEIEAKIVHSAERLSDANQRAVWAMMQQMLREQGNE